MTHQAWTEAFLASPTVLGVIDTSGIEVIHPMREGRSPRQSGRQGLSNPRWMVGGTLGLGRNQWGWVVAWDGGTANVPEKTFQGLMRPCDERMLVFRATALHAAEGDPANLTRCQRGPWKDRMLVETVCAMLTVVSHGKKGMHRVWA